jgi:RNA polymerase sigma-70 factor (ECF subfamily)
MISSITRDATRSAAELDRLFEGLLRDSYRQAFALAFRLTGNSSEAEDLVQDTFVRAYRFFHRFDDSLPFANWLYRIMCNAHIDSVRRRGKLRTTSLEFDTPAGASTLEIPDSSGSPDRDLLDSTMSERVQRCLVEMNPEFRTAVLLADVEGMAYEDIAQTMGTSVGTVRSRIHRGRKQLRQLLVHSGHSLRGGQAYEL